jgi:hypothetical protein
MRVRLLVLVLGVFASPLAATAGEREDAFRAIITSQLEAFKRDDGREAFSFASPTIQGMFGSAENFMAMVERGYPPVFRARAYEFLNTVEIDGKTYQRVRITGADGDIVVAQYEMVEVDGAWRINGCFLTRPEEV